MVTKKKLRAERNCHLNFNELEGKSYEAPCTTKSGADRSIKSKQKEDAFNHAVVIIFIISHFALDARDDEDGKAR